MAKGGTRTGAGRKSKWSTSKTVNIRIPGYLATEVMAYAQQLDRQQSVYLQNQRLISLLEDLMSASHQDRESLLNSLPQSSREYLESVGGKFDLFSTESTFATYSFSDLDDDETSSENRKNKVELEIVEIRGQDLVLCRSSLGHQWLIPKLNGRYMINFLNLPGIPEEHLSLSIEEGALFLQLRSKWVIERLPSTQEENP